MDEIKCVHVLACIGIGKKYNVAIDTPDVTKIGAITLRTYIQVDILIWLVTKQIFQQ